MKVKYIQLNSEQDAEFFDLIEAYSRAVNLKPTTALKFFISQNMPAVLADCKPEIQANQRSNDPQFSAEAGV
jgi:hypothetical protein